MLSEEHVLVLPNNGGGKDKTSDPNCYCSCKRWILPNAIRYTRLNIRINHLYHIIDELATKAEKAGGEKE